MARRCGGAYIFRMPSLKRRQALADDVRHALRLYREDLVPARPVLDMSGTPRPELVAELEPDVPSWFGQEGDILVSGRWKEILRGGCTTWGCVVKLDRRLLEDQDGDHPVVVAWSPEGAWDRRPRGFQALMSRMYRAANADDPPRELHAIAAMLRDERACPRGMVVPSAWTRGRLVVLSALFVTRSHLPGGRVLRTLFPIRFASAEEHPIVVPGALWSADLRRWWLLGGRLEPLAYRIGMRGVPGDADAELPIEIRRHISAYRHLVLAALGMGGVGFGFGILWFLGSWLGVARVVALLAAMVAASSVAFSLAVLSAELLAWARHQRVVDLYRDLWRSGGIGWTRCDFMPTQDGKSRGYALGMRVLGSRVDLVPALERNELIVRVDVSTDPAAPRRRTSSLPIPVDAEERLDFVRRLRRVLDELERDPPAGT